MQIKTSGSDFDLVQYTGQKTVDGYNYDIHIHFIADESAEFQIQRIVVDGDELGDYDIAEFLDYVFTSSDNGNTNYW